MRTATAPDEASDLADFGRGQIFEIEKHHLAVGRRQTMNSREKALDEMRAASFTFSVVGCGEIRDMVQLDQCRRPEPTPFNQVADSNVMRDPVEKPSCARSIGHSK